MKNLIYKDIIVFNFSILFLFIFFNNNILSSSSENDSLSFAKQGGVCFRYDDNVSEQDLSRLVEIFGKYDVKFSLSLNLGEFPSDTYADRVRSVQEMGHEIMDHTPNHRTNYINSLFPEEDYYAQNKNGYINGIDHIIGSKLCLSFEKPDFSSLVKSSTGNISGNTIVGAFDDLLDSHKYIFIDEVDKLFFIKQSNRVDSIKILDVWEEEVNLPILDSIHYSIFDKKDIHITSEALLVLGEESLKLAQKYNLLLPKVWIQPGGDFPFLNREKLKNVLGINLSYVAGAAVEKGKQVFSEYDPFDNERFEMQWGDFFEDHWSFEQCKNTIADRVAKHYLQIGHTQFQDLPGGTESYFEKIDSLLYWLTSNNIPIKTYSEWAEILYDLENDQYKNIFPSLNVDLDKNISELDINGVPDGFVRRYWAGQGQWEIDTVINNEVQYCYSISGVSRICRVDDLAGIEKGSNEFRIKTKGQPGDSVLVRFEFSDTTSSTDLELKFPADTKDWNEYSIWQSTNGNTELIIPETESIISIDIYCSDFSTGKVKIKGMYLAKSRVTDINETEENLTNSINLSQNYPNPFNPETKIRYSLTKSNVVKLKVYDILGCEVSTLIDEKQNVGVYEINFDGSKLASGIYFYTLNTGSAFQTKKMILMK